MSKLRAGTFNLIAIGFLGLVAFGVLSRPQWEWPALIICVIASGFAALLGNMDEFESFKAGTTGIEAKTREVVREAKAAVSEIQLLAKEVATVMADMIDAEGRYGGALTSVEKDARKAALRSTLTRLGLSENEISAAFEPGMKWALIDYRHGLLRDLREGDTPQSNALFGFLRSLPDGDPLPVREIRELFLAAGVEPWRLELLADYEFVLKHKRHRRPGIWAQRGRWPDWTKENAWPE